MLNDNKQGNADSNKEFAISSKLELEKKENSNTQTNPSLQPKIALHSNDLTLLKSPTLLDDLANILDRKCAGETRNKKLLLMAVIARYIVTIWSHVSGTSRGGKDTLVRWVLRLLPKEDVVDALRFTARAIEYQFENLTGTIFYVSEKEGLEPIIPTLKALYGKHKEDPTEIPTAKEILIVYGCPSIINTSLLPDKDPATLNRMTLLLSVNETQAQTEAVLKLSAENYAHPFENDINFEKFEAAKQTITMYPKNATVVIPYALRVKFPSSQVRYRGDYKKFEDLNIAHAYVYQYQRIRIIGKERVIVIAEEKDFHETLALSKAVLDSSMMNLSPTQKSLYDTIKPLFSVKSSISLEEITKKITELTHYKPDTVRLYLDYMAKAGLVFKEKTGAMNRYSLTSINENDDTNQIGLLASSDKEKETLNSIKEAVAELLRTEGSAKILYPDGNEKTIMTISEIEEIELMAIDSTKDPPERKGDNFNSFN
jgi:hypothetical protein